MKSIQERLKTDLKKTLENEICSVQALDVWQDRNRVLKEILKTLNNYKISWPHSMESTAQSKK